MTWRSEKYKRAAAKRTRKPIERIKFPPGAPRDPLRNEHTQTHMRAKEGLAGLNGRISGEGQ